MHSRQIHVPFLKGMLGCLMLMLCLHPSASAQVDSLKQNADLAYIEGNYSQAADLYEQVIKQEYVSPEVFYNLGNAYYKSGQIAPAVLNYERAKKLAPNDEDIIFNLRLANLSVKDRAEEMPHLFFSDWWIEVMGVFGTDGWAWSAVIAFGIALLILLIFRLSKEEGLRKLSFFVGIILLLWTGFSLYAAQKNFKQAMSDERAVVFSPTLNAKSAPDQKGKDLFVIHEGLVVTVSEQMNGWARIKLSNGNVGWVPLTEIRTI